MFPASLYLPPFAGSVCELATADHWLGAVLGVTDSTVNKPEALAGGYVEGFGIVGHEADGSGLVFDAGSGAWRSEVHNLTHSEVPTETRVLA